MKSIGRLIVLFAILLSPMYVSAEYVNGYYDTNGAYVPPYYKSELNDTSIDNDNIKEDVNAYNGEVVHDYYMDDMTSRQYDKYNRSTLLQNNDYGYQINSYGSDYIPIMFPDRDKGDKINSYNSDHEDRSMLKYNDKGDEVNGYNSDYENTTLRQTAYITPESYGTGEMNSLDTSEGNVKDEEDTNIYNYEIKATI